MGAFNFLEKPLSLDKTITEVHNALERKTLRQENAIAMMASVLPNEP